MALPFRVPPSWCRSCCGAQQDRAISGTQLYSQSHGGSLGWADTRSFRCFTTGAAKRPLYQLCSRTGLANPNCILLATSVLEPQPAWQQGSPVQGHSLFPWRTTWPHLGFL